MWLKLDTVTWDAHAVLKIENKAFSKINVRPISYKDVLNYFLIGF